MLNTTETTLSVTLYFKKVEEEVEETYVVAQATLG